MNPTPPADPPLKSGMGFLCLILMLLAGTGAFADPLVVAYYPEWAVYARNYHVYNMPVDQLTHVCYSFADIQNGEIGLMDPYADIDRFYPGDSWDPDSLRGSFHQLMILKAAHPHLKTLISIGGWGTDGFSDAALTDSSRLRFARSCSRFLVRYQFDGVDIDWEYPVSGSEPGQVERPVDRANFTLLMQALRSQFDSLEAVRGQHYFLSAALAAIGQNAHYDIPAVWPLLDFLNIMTYDFHGSWDTYTHFNSPLYGCAADPYGEPLRTRQTADSAIRGYLAQGVPAAKLVLGVAFWGKGYGNVANVNNGLFQPFSGVSTPGTWESGSFDYWDLAANYVNHNGYTRYYQSEAQSPWLYNPATHVFITYDDSQSVAARGQYVLSHNLGGAMFWEIASDRNGVLLNSLYASLYCRAPFGLTSRLELSAGIVHLRFTAPVTGSYRIWRTTVKNNDGNPDGGADPDWTPVGTVNGTAGAALDWSDNGGLTAYVNYVVTSVCTP
jgi:chitinase